ncbi:hypothetical protein [Delftia tsuruhatensis]|uniref:Uncharacterized protein n=1 Tax=Delftia tsuruhatensis TaxID=180282 RepID=A0AAX3SSP7_9BURK|nr:hypothetical protein [Delftia tsuruhatensis]WFF83105.1 hypothetical protein PYR84_10535 [Delftia tsuruhatensis]
MGWETLKIFEGLLVMPIVEYSLFRVKFIKPNQRSLFNDKITSEELFKAAVLQRPSAELRAGYHWHIGNVHMFDDAKGYFAIGRTTVSSIEKFDEVTGNFIEEETEEGPYTHCVFDSSVGFVGIAKKVILSSTSKGVANRLEQLLSLADGIVENNVLVEVRPIPDPDGFLKAITNAYKVYSYTATFRGPNPFDADEYFQKPLAVYLSAANGYRGKATINGDDLNRDVLVEVTRSTAATGNEASARIQKNKKQKAITVNLRGDPIKRRYDEKEHHPEIVLNDLENQYIKVRHNEVD